MSTLPVCQTLSLEPHNGVLHITLNRPECRNAMSLQMVSELRAVLAAVRDDRQVRALVLGGAGGHFCAGGDLKDMANARAQGADAYRELNRAFGALLEEAQNAPQVLICVLQGAVLGGGFGLACVSDIALADDQAQFGLPETSLGLLPAQIAPFVVQRIGLTQTRRLALTAARFVWVFGSDAIILLLRAMGLRRYSPIGPRGATVLGWAGMRGVVTLAVALSVPEGFPGRDFLLVAAFGVILGTVLIQGTTLGLLIRWAGLSDPIHDRPRLSMSDAEAAIAKVQAVRVEQLAYDAAGELIHPQLLERYQRRAVLSKNYAGQEEQFADRLHAHFDLVLEAIAAGRAELLRLHRAGDIDEHVLQELERDLDLEELTAWSMKS